MKTLSEFLDYYLDNLYEASGFSESLKKTQKIINFTNKYTIPTPVKKYTGGLDSLMPKPEFLSGGFDTFSFSDLKQSKLLKQTTSSSISSWNPDVSSFTPEGSGTLGYSPWNISPLNNGTSTADRVSRITHAYTDRKFPIRGPSGTSFTNVDYFSSSFWISIGEPGSAVAETSFSINIPKSYFLACNHYDSSQRPTDINIYTNSEFASNISSNNWTGISLTYYSALTATGFTITGETATHYTFLIDSVSSGIPQTPAHNHYLVCAGSNYVPTTTRSATATISPSQPYSTYLSILRFIDDYRSDAVILPKTYDTETISAFYNTNQTRTGVPSGLSRGNVVVLSAQTNSDENGIYAVDSGSWTKLSDYIRKNLNFIKIQNYGLTGSSLLVSSKGNFYDAATPDMKLVANSSDNVNPGWLMLSYSKSKIISNISSTGPIYDSFSVDTFNYDIGEKKSIGSSSINYNKSEIKIINRKLFFTSVNPSVGRITAQSFTIGTPTVISGVLPTFNIGSEIYICSTPSDFVICEVLFSSSNTCQVLPVKIFGGPSSDLKVFEDGIIFNAIDTTSDFEFIPETYQRQLFYSFPKLKQISFSTLSQIEGTQKIISLKNEVPVRYMSSIALNPGLLHEASKQFGYKTSEKEFNFFEWFGFLKSFSKNSTMGTRVSPQINYLNSDLDYSKYTYEYFKQINDSNNSKAFVDNSITTTALSSQEFEINFLNKNNVFGEASAHYTSLSPLFTGSNVITRSTDFTQRVNIQDNYGNPYQTSESFFVQPVIDATANFANISKNINKYGENNRYSFEDFWATFTGPYDTGIAMSNSLFVLGGITNPLKNTSSSITSKQIYLYAYTTGSKSDMVFDGKSVMIPLPLINYDSRLQSCEIYVKFLGQPSFNGFLRARILDLSDFYKFNTTDSAKTLASSENVSVNYIGDTYVPVRFSFNDDASFNSRRGFGQHLFLEIEKVGDFNPATLIIRCANQSRDLFYQTISGTRINTNLQISSTAESYTGSVIYNLYKYTGNLISTQSSIQPPNTFATQIVRFPYLSNVLNSSFNAPSDYVNVSVSGSVSGSTGFTGAPIISLSDAIGIENYSFGMFTTYTGPTKNISFGVPVSQVNQKPKGYHMLISVKKSHDDNLPSAYIELEKDFVYNSLMVPETTLYITSGDFVGAINTNNSDSSILTSEKSSIINSISTSSRSDMIMGDRKLSYITPRTGYTGPVLLGGLAEDQNIDFVFKNSSDQIYHRESITATAGMLANSYEGSANGIEEDFFDLPLVESKTLTTSIFNGTLFTGSSLVNTNIFINFVAPASYGAIRVTGQSGSLIKIQNLTTNAFTGPWQGPIVKLDEDLSSGSKYNMLITLMGIPATQIATIEYYDGAYRTFNITSGSIFAREPRTNVVIHPEDAHLIYVRYGNEDDNPSLTKRYTR